MKPTLLIVCTGNSCRSQMAEAFLRHAVGDAARVLSAGSKPAAIVHPLAVRVMAELGLDLAGQRPKHLREFLDTTVDTVITVCGVADQNCPIFPGQVNRHHWRFDDPAHTAGTEEEVIREFRRVRDEMKRIFTAYGAGLREGAANAR